MNTLEELMDDPYLKDTGFSIDTSIPASAP